MNLLLLFILFLLILVNPISVKAVCPVCTVAVVGGLGISRWLGIDDSITGVWIGGFILSSGLWLADWLKKKKLKIPYPEFVSVLIMTVFVIPSLYWSKMIGLEENSLWGIDKVILGIIAGIIVFLFGVFVDKYLRTKNEGKVFFYFQKVILPVFFLTLTSFIFYQITIN